MNCERIDLYKEFGLERTDGCDGYLTCYVPKANTEIKPKIRPAMIVCPGGGYAFRSEREGEPVAIRFLSKGYSAFLLEYTVNKPFPTALIESAAAVAYIRRNAERYSVDVNHVGAIGFSAGGHLVGSLATMFGDDAIAKALAIPAEQCRPDAVVLSYPVVTMSAATHGGTREIITGGDVSLRDRLSVEKRVTKDSAPAFIWHTFEDDGVPVVNSLSLASAYLKCGVPFGLHIFEKGWHGLSLISDETHDDGAGDTAFASVSAWVELALDFLSDRGFKARN